MPVLEKKSAAPAPRPAAIPDEAAIAAAKALAEGCASIPELLTALHGFEGCGLKFTAKSLVFADGNPVATGALFLFDGVALLAGASTVPAARGRGAQNALLAARLHFAAERGAALALMGASPGSQSQKNAEKHGFRVAYTRTKWLLGPA